MTNRRKPEPWAEPKAQETLLVIKLNDFNGTLEDLWHAVNDLYERHGGDSNIKFDAGHNNVQVLLTPAPKTLSQRLVGIADSVGCTAEEAADLLEAAKLLREMEPQPPKPKKVRNG